MSHYVYFHRKATDGSVFYIGIGTGDRYRYFLNRNKHWHNTANKYGVVPEIVVYCDDYNHAKSWEVYLIGLYGRNDLGNGHLVNKTAGGDGAVDYKHDDTSKSLMKKLKMDKYGIPCDVYKVSDRSFVGSFDCIMDVSRSLGLESSGVSACVRRRTITFKGYVILRKGEVIDWEYILNNSGKHIASVRNSTPVSRYTLDGEYIDSFKSASEACRVTGVAQTTISHCVKGKAKTAGGFIWRKTV
jgi:hypothetical protein